MQLLIHVWIKLIHVSKSGPFVTKRLSWGSQSRWIILGLLGVLMQKYLFFSLHSISNHFFDVSSIKQFWPCFPSGSLSPTSQLFQTLSVPSDQRNIPSTSRSVQPSQCWWELKWNCHSHLVSRVKRHRTKYISFVTQPLCVSAYNNKSYWL